MGQRLETGHADRPDAEALHQPLRRRHADSQAGEQPRPHIHADRIELADRHAGLRQDVVDGRGERLHVTAAARDGARGPHTPGVAHGDADELGGGLDAEEHHGAASTTTAGPSAPSSARRPAHASSTAVILTVRRSS